MPSSFNLTDLCLNVQAEMARRIPGFGGKLTVQKRVSRRLVRAFACPFSLASLAIVRLEQLYPVVCEITLQFPYNTESLAVCSSRQVHESAANPR